MAGLIDTILKIPLFSGLSREDIAKILGRLEEISFRSGAVIFSQGDAGDAPCQSWLVNSRGHSTFPCLRGLRLLARWGSIAHGYREQNCRE